MSADRPVRAVLFDLDGTLVDSLPTIAEAASLAFARHGIALAAEAIVPHIGPPMEVVARDLGRVDEAKAAAINEDYLAIYYGDGIGRTLPREGAGALLDRLEAAGIALAIVTNKAEAGAHRMVEVVGWTGRFGAVVGRDTAAPKPDPAGTHHALRALGVSPEEAVFVGDTEFDMRCGRDAGLGMVIGITGARAAEQLRATGASHVVDHLDQVGPLLLAGAPA